ncbi:MAG: FixH family protein [bacterium]
MGTLRVVVCLALLTGCRESATPQSATPAPYEISLRPPEGGLFAGEEMPIEFRLTARSPDAAAGSTAVRYARVECTIDMPSMPGMPAFTELAHAEGVAGEYGVHPTFAHGGDYRLRIRVLPPSEQPSTMTPRPTAGYEAEIALAVADAPPPGRPRGSAAAARYKVSVEPATTPPRAGEPNELRVVFWKNVQRQETQPDGGVRVVGGGEPITEFDPSHERLLHLFVMRDDLGTFAHEHPRLGDGGTFTLPFTFPTGGAYVVFADAAPRGAGSQVVATRLWVEGATAPRFDLAAAYRGDRGLSQTRGDVTLDWTLPGDPLPAGKTVRLRARVTDRGGRPIEDLEPYLGAYGHLMMVSEGGGAFVHAHPDETRGGPVDGVVEFLARMPEPGLYRGWAQIQRAGEVLTFDFVVRAGGDRPGTTQNATPVVR